MNMENRSDQLIDGLYVLLAVLVLLAALTGYCGYRNWEEAVQRGDNTVPTIIDDQAGGGRALPGDRGYAPGGEATPIPSILLEPTPLLANTERTAIIHHA